MRSTLHVSLLAVTSLLLACGQPADSTLCDCVVPMPSGSFTLACGQTLCLEGLSLRCAGPGPSGRLEQTFDVCPSPQQACTPTSCAAASAQCGIIDDGCGGIIDCGGCSAGANCFDNACRVDVCAQAGAVCGTVQGVSCGTCPGTSTCSATGKACIEKVGTLPFSQYTVSSVLSGDTLYATGPRTSGATTKDVVALSLSTGQVTTVAGAVEYLSPLTANGTHLFWTSDAGLFRLPLAGGQPEAVPGLSGGCNSLLADGQRVFCGLGGDARYGVSFYGVKALPVAGGTATWLVSYLNYPHLALANGMLFHVGTTDNYYSFAVLGVTYLSDNQEQSLVSGGSLDSRFVLADQHAFYFVAENGSTSALTRAPYDNSPSTDVFTGQGFLAERTVSNGAELWTVAKVGAAEGLFRASVTGGTPEQLADAADLGGDIYDVQALWKSGDALVVIAGTDVLRLFRPGS